jgi:vacuolar-type H+-ATPase subunit E/Vma4
LKKTPEDFEDQEISLVYIAKTLKDALRLEDVLTGSGIDYIVETDQYVGGVVFRSERTGAFFYVSPEALAAAVSAMNQSGFTPHT